MTKQEKTERAEAIETLRQLCPLGTTVYTETAHVSRSGMQRLIRCFVALPEGHAWRQGGGREVQAITGLVARACGYSVKNREGFGYDVLKVDGCGSDMGFEVVYNLGHALYPEGFPVAGVGRNGDTSGHDRDGGYALKQRWL